MRSYTDDNGLRDYRPAIGAFPSIERPPVHWRRWVGYVALVLSWAIFAFVVLHR